MRLYAAIAAVITAATCPPLSPATRGRIEAGYRLKSCLKVYHKDVCLPLSNIYCKSLGLEDNCAVDELWSDPTYYSPSR